MLTTSEYENLWSTCKLTEDPVKTAELALAQKLINVNQSRYSEVEKRAQVPWPVIAAIHFRESGCSFTRHLHNGDPLSARTVHVPSGRPTFGEPPFRWEDSAVDALSLYWTPPDWSVGHFLMFMERYNGLGYQKHSVNTPYLWSYTNQYTSGLYVEDGSFDPGTVSKQAGTVAILKSLGVPLDFSSIVSRARLLH